MAQNWMENFSYFEGSSYKHFRFHPIYYGDLNDYIQILVTDENNSYKGKKLIANGTESLSYYDVDNGIKQAYSTEGNHLEPNRLLQKTMFNWQLFFNGNTHITNMDFMLKFLQNRNPQFTSFENAGTVLSSKPKSFREYHNEKSEKKLTGVDKEKVEKKSDKNTIESIKEIDQYDSHRYPLMQNYWNQSLD
jgi:hypothetical protein